MPSATQNVDVQFIFFTNSSVRQYSDFFLEAILWQPASNFMIRFFCFFCYPPLLRLFVLAKVNIRRTTHHYTHNYYCKMKPTMKFVTEKVSLSRVILWQNRKLISVNNIQAFLWGRRRRFSGFFNVKFTLKGWQLFIKDITRVEPSRSNIKQFISQKGHHSALILKLVKVNLHSSPLKLFLPTS